MTESPAQPSIRAAGSGAHRRGRSPPLEPLVAAPGGNRAADTHRPALGQRVVGAADRRHGADHSDRHRAEPSRASRACTAFIKRYPGIAQAAPSVDSGFPWWLQLQHFVNMFFMLFIIRAGIQILADHPRLYWKRDCTPGTDWFRFQLPVPKGRVWTSKDDSVTIPGMAGHSRRPPFARPCAMVALLGQPALGDQRRPLLRAAVLHRPMAPAGAAHLGRVPGRALHRDPVRVAELPGRPQLDPLQRPATAQLFRRPSSSPRRSRSSPA